MTNPNTRYILSCDGGGIRGLITAVMLEQLEEKLQAKNPDTTLRDYFDLVAGTSIGSIIACAISKGIPARQIKDIHLKAGIEIFPKFHKVAQVWLNRMRLGLSQPIYDGKGLEAILQDQAIFGRDLQLKDLTIPTLVTSYDTYNRQTVVMVSTDPDCAQIPVWEACRASAAAPTAFPAHLVSEPNFIASLEQKGYTIPLNSVGAKAIPLIDGGVFANNPSLCAVAHSLSQDNYLEQSELTVVSFGTGHNVKEIGIDAAREWGVLEWLSPRRGIPLLDTLFDGSSDMVDFTMQKLLPECSYYRFQIRLEANLPAFQANPDNMVRMIEAAKTYLAQPEVEQKMEQLVMLLTPRNPTQIPKLVASVTR